MLSFVPPLLFMTTLVMSENASRIPARILVSLTRKSAVLLTPKTMEASAPPPPKVPAKPPPFDDWMNQSGMKNFTMEILNSDSFRQRKIFNTEKVKTIFQNKQKYPKFPYWRILNLELWSQIYGIDNL